MNFKEIIDHSYKEKVDQFNENLISIQKLDIKYIENKLIVYKKGIFQFGKRETYMKLLIEDFMGRRIYLTDYEIIDLIQEFNYSKYFIKLLKELDEGIIRKMNIKIGDRSVNIDAPKSFERQWTKKDLYTKGDFCISFNELFILVLLILAKESNQGIEQMTLFIILSEFYLSKSNKDSKHYTLLKDLDYKVECSSAEEAYKNQKFDYNLNLKKHLFIKSGKIKVK